MFACRNFQAVDPESSGAYFIPMTCYIRILRILHLYTQHTAQPQLEPRMPWSCGDPYVSLTPSDPPEFESTLAPLGSLGK